MSYASVQNHIWSNTVSNYLRTAVGMVVGVVTFRLLFERFSKEEFGFWSLLWSVFGYGILLDFGFGFAAQKEVATLSVSRDWAQLSRVLSTIIGFYGLIAALVATLVGLGSHQLIAFFGITAGNEEAFRLVMIVFFGAIALAFPMGIFVEILRGQQRIALANNLTIGCMIVRLGLIWQATHSDWSFLSIMLIALGFALLPDLLAAFFALRALPEVTLRPRHMSVAVLKHTAGFSLIAYIATASNIILGKSDQLVLSGTLGVAAVALYQAGAKVAEVFQQFTKQLQDTFSPAAAHLHAMGDHHAIGDLIVKGLRWSILIATPLYIMSAAYLNELLQVLTGETTLSQDTYFTAQVLLAWFYTTIITHSVGKRIFIVTGHEHRLMWMGIAEAVANLVLSIALVLTFRSIVAVAIGSLIPTLIIGWARMWPWMAQASALSPSALFARTVWPAWRACAPAALLIFTAAQWAPQLRFANPWTTLFTHGPITALIGALSVWTWGLDASERAALLARVMPTPTSSLPIAP